MKTKFVLIIVLFIFLITQIASHQVLCIKSDGSKIFEYSVLNLKCDCFDSVCKNHNHPPQKSNSDSTAEYTSCDSCFDLLIDPYSLKFKKSINSQKKLLKTIIAKQPIINNSKRFGSISIKMLLTKFLLLNNSLLNDSKVIMIC